MDYTKQPYVNNSPLLIIYLPEWICNAMGNKTPAAL